MQTTEDRKQITDKRHDKNVIPANAGIYFLNFLHLTLVFWPLIYKKEILNEG